MQIYHRLPRLPHLVACVLCLIVLVLASGLPAASAQHPSDHDATHSAAALAVQRHDRHHAHDGINLRAMLDSLKLSDEQRSQIIDIMREHRNSVREAHQTSADQPRSRDREHMEAQRAELRQQILAVLTPEQRSQFIAMYEQQGAEHAERGEQLRARHEALKPMMAELRAYKHQTVRPALLELRRDFDRKLTPAERNTIDQLRKEMQAERQRIKAAFKAHFAGSDNPRAGRDELHAQREAFHQAHAAQFAAVEAIVKAHKADLEAVRAEMQRRETTWKPELDAIMAKYLTAEELARQAQRREHRGAEHTGKGKPHHPHESHKDEAAHRAEDGHRPHHRKHKGSRLDHDSKKALSFLLLDPAGTAVDVDEQDDAALLDGQPSNDRFSVYPNPAHNEAQVAVEVRQAGIVQIDLIDANGQVLRQLYRQSHDAGELKVSVDLGGTAPQSGVIRITDGAGVRTQVLARQ